MKQRKKILIAEDERSIGELLKIILDENYDLDFVEDGKKIIDKVKKVSPDLLLLDVMMPNMNGYDVCKALRNDKKTKDVKIAILSAKGQERDILTGLKSGADYYITKPFDPNELQNKINEILGD